MYLTWRNWRDIENVREIDNIRDAGSYAIQSQYAASKKITALAAAYQMRLDPTADIDTFYEKIFTIYTAEGAGLDTWGLILQIDRVIETPGLPDPYTRLDDEYYRMLLLYKAMANISASTAAAQNELLAALVNTGVGDFPRVAYVLEVDTMVIRWVFEAYLNPLQLAVFRAAGTLARGAGVGWELYAIDPQQVFGFDGSGMQPFNQAPFAPDILIIAY